MASSLGSLYHYSLRYRAKIFLASFFSIINKILDIAPPVLIGMAVDTVVQKEQSFLANYGYTDVMSQIWVLAGLTALIWGFESITEYICKVLWRGLAQDIQHNMRLDAYDHMQSLDMQFFENQSSGQLMAILNDDVNQLERFLDVGANEILQMTTTIVLISGIFFWFAPETAAIAFLPIPFIIMGSFYFHKKLGPRYAKVREQAGLLNHKLANNLGGMLTLKSYTTEEHESEQLNKKSQAYNQANKSAIRLSTAFHPVLRVFVFCGFTYIMIRGAYQVDSGTLAVGAYSMMIFMIQRMLWPFTHLGEVVDLYQRAMASVNRLIDLLGTPITIQPGKSELRLQKGEGAIALQNVGFSYLEGFPVFNDLSLTMPAGKTTAIVGTTGAGKSTLIKLILRLFEPQTGQILIDGKALPDFDLQELRRNIALVSQDVFLFHGTVKENIKYGSPEATDEEIMAAAKISEAHDFISKLPQGYDTIVGERGIKLSGGQRQRVSIARAILKNAPILILDEATSSVDNETEAAIQRSLAKISKNRTTIVLAHRLSTIRHADQIVVIEHGKILQQGTHEELSLNPGLYQNLWQVQTGSTQAPKKEAV